MIEISGLRVYNILHVAHHKIRFFKVFYKIQCADAGFEISRVPVGLKTHLGVFFWKIMLIGRFLAGIGRI